MARRRALDAAPDWIAEPYRLQLDGGAEAAAEGWRRRLCPYEAARTLADAGDEAALTELDGLGARPAAREPSGAGSGCAARARRPGRTRPA